MSWTLNEDTITKNNKEIAYLLPSASEAERRMIKNGDELIDYLGAFVCGYDEGKTPSKKLFDQLKRLVDLCTDYKVRWSLTKEGELINQNGDVICIITNTQSIDGKAIALLPEVYDISQRLAIDLSSVRGLTLKKLYNRVCEFYDKASE
jgi:hypothetical protein